MHSGLREWVVSGVIRLEMGMDMTIRISDEGGLRIFRRRHLPKRRAWTWARGVQWISRRTERLLLGTGYEYTHRLVVVCIT